MEFGAWEEWNSQEVAFYISNFCDLPQYETALGKNLNGLALKELCHANLLSKGLSRAGVCDFDHQRLIVGAVRRLATQDPQILSMELRKRLELQSVGGAKIIGRDKDHKARAARNMKIAKNETKISYKGSYGREFTCAPQPTITVKSMKKSNSMIAYAKEHYSSERMSPVPWGRSTPSPVASTAASLAPSPAEKMLGSSGSEPVLSTRVLRKKIANSRKAYDIMRCEQEELEAERLHAQSISILGEAHDSGVGVAVDEETTQQSADNVHDDKAVASALSKGELMLRFGADDGSVAEVLKQRHASRPQSTPKTMDAHSAVSIQSEYRSTSKKRADGLLDWTESTDSNAATGGGLRGLQKLQAEKREEETKKHLNQVAKEKEEEEEKERLRLGRRGSGLTLLDTMNTALEGEAAAEKAINQDESSVPLSPASKGVSEKSDHAHALESSTLCSDSLQDDGSPRVETEGGRKSKAKHNSREGGLFTQSAEQKDAMEAWVAGLDDNAAAAATKLQAHERGRIARMTVSQKLHAQGVVAAAEEDQKLRARPSVDQSMDAERVRLADEQRVAATKLQCAARRRAAWREAELRRHKKQEQTEQAKAATKIQALHRGKIGRRNATAKKASLDSQ